MRAASREGRAVPTGSGSPDMGAAMEMERIKAVGGLELEYATWNLPRAERDERSEKSKSVLLAPALLFEPGAYFLRSTSGSENSWLKKRCSRFQATMSTRCVRDIKRDLSWKIYGVSCNPDTGAEAHYVRIRFISKEKDRAFAPLADLLNALAAKRFLQSSRREKVHPFGIGFDAGVKSKERCYIISNCAKQTPFLRRVDVQFEVLAGGEWKRVDTMVDRIGFATYKSASKSSILAASTLDAVTFKDDAYLRFARITLRFGERSERTILDVGKNFEPQLVYTKTSTVLNLNRVRVRTCEGRNVSEPVQTQARLIFTDMKPGSTRTPFRRGSLGKHCSSEAEKALALLKRTVQLAGVNTLALEDDLPDDAIFEMNIQRVITNNDFSIRAKGEIPSSNMSLYSLFKNSTMFLVPCYDSNGLQLILQSRDGEYVLRQYVARPINFIGTITANCFSGPNFSTISRVGETSEYDGSGKITYMFETGETDASTLVETVVSIIEKLHTYQTTTGNVLPPSDPGILPPFMSLPRIPQIPSIHLSRPTTATTRTPTIFTRPTTASTTPTPPQSILASPTPPQSIFLAPASPPPSFPPPSPPISITLSSPSVSTTPSSPPVSTNIAPPLLTIYKVPRKPVPTSATSSIRSASPQPTHTAPQPMHMHALPAQGLLVPDPSTQPGGRLYELRTKTLKRVITGLETGLQGTVRTVTSRS